MGGHHASWPRTNEDISRSLTACNRTCGVDARDAHRTQHVSHALVSHLPIATVAPAVQMPFGWRLNANRFAKCVREREREQAWETHTHQRCATVPVQHIVCAVPEAILLIEQRSMLSMRFGVLRSLTSPWPSIGVPPEAPHEYSVLSASESSGSSECTTLVRSSRPLCIPASDANTARLRHHSCVHALSPLILSGMNSLSATPYLPHTYTSPLAALRHARNPQRGYSQQGKCLRISGRARTYQRCRVRCAGRDGDRMELVKEVDELWHVGARLGL